MCIASFCYAKRCARTGVAMWWCHVLCGTTVAYAATRRSGIFLSWTKKKLPGYYHILSCYAMSGTDVSYGAIKHFQVCSTDLGYGATECPVLQQRMLLPIVRC
eukprot:2168042-Rhodomonas_salina.1